MTTRRNLIAALEGDTPERPPLSIYDWNMGAITAAQLAAKMREDDWRQLFDQGLGVTSHCEILEAVEHGVETVTENEAGRQIIRKRTPLGELRKVTRGGWHEEEWVKEPRDYKVAQWIVENTELRPQYERFAEHEATVGEHGVTVVTGSGNWLHRTPLMKINIDWAGTEQFCMDVAMEVPELFALYAALKKQFMEEQRLIAAGPGRYVKWLENLTISMIGPDRYRDYLTPVYREGFPILEAAGKRVMVHYDGALRVIADQIAAAPFHMIESLTEPPEGDMLYDECRRLWPDKGFWANLNIELYDRPADELAQAVRERVRRAGRRGLAFEISEDLPRNWKGAIPVILKTLSE
jgi:hypothetical protein